MRIQGWGIPIAVAVCADFAAPNEQNVSRRGRPLSAESGVRPSPHTETGRSELLASIKQRIKSGFYNSETVIDDLGHGFAQALDPTL